MRREEAITNLEMISVAFVEPVTKEQRNLINDTFDMAIKALQDKGRDRKKAKRFKNKYLKLKTAIEKIKAEIENQKKIDVEDDDVVFSIRCISCGLNIALDIINKHIGDKA
jgi:hypothetical protein